MSTYDQTGHAVRTCKTCGALRPVARGLCQPCYTRAYRAGEHANGEKWKHDGHHDTSGARCRCGLRLPCNDCTATNAADHAANRMYRESAV